MKKVRLVGVVVLLMFSTSSFADNDFLVRPHFGVGHTSGGDVSGTATHIGSRFLLRAGSGKISRYV